MKDCKKYERLIEKSMNGELSDIEYVMLQNHMDTCAKCKNEFIELRNTLNLFKAGPEREPDADFMENFWENLEPNLDIKESREKTSVFSFIWDDIINSIRNSAKWKYQLAGATAILIIGVLIGRYFNETDLHDINSPSANNKAAITESAVNAQAASYVERSKILMLGLMNFDPSTDNAETISLQHQMKISRELLTQASGLKTELKKPSQQQMKKLVSDIEVILLQIANLETQYNLDGIEMIKDGVESKGIFLKINIMEINKSNGISKPSVKHENNSKKL